MGRQKDCVLKEVFRNGQSSEKKLLILDIILVMYP